VEEVLPADDFGPPHGPPDFGNSADLGNQTVIYGNSFSHEKSPQNTGFCGLSEGFPRQTL